MTPKFNILARQLNRADAASKSETEKVASSALLSRQDKADNEAKEAKESTKTLMDQLAKAQEEIASLNKQLVELGKESMQKQNVLLHKISDTKDVAKQEMDALCSKHNSEMGYIAGQIETLKTELASECQAKVKAEAERDGANRMCANMERIVTKLQDVKPVALAPVVPVIKEQKLVVFKITKRDENGRAVEFSQTQ